MKRNIAGMHINLPELQVENDSTLLEEKPFRDLLEDYGVKDSLKKVYEFDSDTKHLESSEVSWLPQLKGEVLTTNQTNYERYLLEDPRDQSRYLFGAMYEDLTRDFKYIALGGFGINIIDNNQKYRVVKGRMSYEYYLSKTQRKLIIHSLIKYARRNRNKEFLSILKLIRSNLNGKQRDLYFDISRLTIEDAKILVKFIKQTRKVPYSTVNNSLIPDNRLYVIRDRGEQYAPYMPLSLEPTHVRFNGVASIKGIAKVNIC